MRAKIRGKIWNLKPCSHLKAWGECDAPTKPSKEIRYRQSLRNQPQLETFIHEMLHAALWDLDEEAIEETAHDIARTLWKLGYRRDENLGT